MAKTPAKAPFVVPKAIGACADLLYTTRLSRLAEQKDITEYETREKALKEHIIQELPKSQTTGVAGKVARVTVNTTAIPVVEDWDAFYEYVKKTGQFDLLQRRLNETAVAERWEAGKKIPGVGTFNVVKVSCVKV